MERDEGMEDDAPRFGWLPPDDRLWRHPSELAGSGPPSGDDQMALADALGLTTPGPAENEDIDPASGPTLGPGGVPTAATEAESDPKPSAPTKTGRRGRHAGPRAGKQADKRRPGRRAGGSRTGASRTGASRAPRAGAPASHPPKGSPANPGPKSQATSNYAAREIERRMWTVAIMAGVVGALVASGAAVVVGRYGRTTTVVRPIEQITPAGSVITMSTNPQATISAIADRLRPSIVQLLVSSNGSNIVGSGVVYATAGFILTNREVVEGAQKVVAVMSNGKRVACKLIGTDQTTDVAVVQLQGGKSPAPAMLGHSELRVGETAIALGSDTAASGSLLVTSGIISDVDSQINPLNGPPLSDVIQTDAQLSPRSTGGALVDENGMVVGITASVTVGDQGMQTLSVATPIEVASDAATQLIQTGHVVHAWLGVQGANLDDGVADNLGISGGAVVESIDANSPAARSGLAVSDIITSFDGTSVGSMYALNAALRQHRPGDRPAVSYIHDGELHTTRVLLLRVPSDND